MVYLFNSDVTLKATPQLDAFGRLRVSNPFTLFDSQQRFGLDASFRSNVASGGSVTFIPTQSSANLTVTNTTGSFAARESAYTFRYQPGKSLLVMMTFTMAPASPGNTRQRIGYFGTDNGFYVELANGPELVQRSNVTGTVTLSNVAQVNWNGDKLLGSGPSGLTLDITKSQILWIDMEWLGVGSVRMGFVINGLFILCHTFHHANLVVGAYITTACLPVRYEIQTLNGAAPATSNLTQICSTVMSEGGSNAPLTLYSNLATFSETVGAGTWVPVISVRLAAGRLDSVCAVRQIEALLTSAGDTVQWALWSNVSAANLTGENFLAAPPSTSILVDKSATAFSATTCQQVASGMVSSGAASSSSITVFELGQYFSQIGRTSFTQTSDIMTLAFFNNTGQGTVDAQVLLSWQELL
jgi:hypothetical protein